MSSSADAEAIGARKKFSKAGGAMLEFKEKYYNFTI
jgi:hypothetical protein